MKAALFPFALFVSIALCCPPLPAAEADEAAGKVSYYEQIRPIFQAHCQGCHQPAKANGEYVMTSFDLLTKGGETGDTAIVPGKPAESHLMELITPVDGEAEMPKGKKPLADSEIALVRSWIEAGALDDTPENAKDKFSMDNPPVYSRPPVITSMDFSPDGKLLAIAGFHEVLLASADGKLLARLVGVSERIETVSFSPDGKLLCVTGGLPYRMGEVQVWDVEKRALKLSVPITYDTVYGGSWSPDGKLIAIGCADNTVRAISAETGEQVLFQGVHSDWVRDTVFTNDGSHLVSVGLDMTCKLTEVKTERFVDNVTSITPGVLKGGVNTVTRHPVRDEIVVGGSDGEVKVYRVFRLTVRRIGDDANLIRRMPAMKGRVFDVDVSNDGKRIAAVSSLNGVGQFHIYSYEFDTALPDDIKKINEKVGRTPAERKRLNEYLATDVKLIAQAEFASSGLYAVAFQPDGKLVAVSGGDGVVRLIDATTGSVTREFSPAPISDDSESLVAANKDVEPLAYGDTTVETESLPAGAVIKTLTVVPKSIDLQGEFSYAQLLVTAHTDSGDVLDVTRMLTAEASAPIVSVSPRGIVTPLADGNGKLTLKLAGRAVEIPVVVSDVSAQFESTFVSHVNPVLSRLGCNAGTCHGAAKGRNGFKLSLRGYDPILDVRALTDDLASRRVNVASPDDSLMLMKATGAVPHVGSQLIRPGESYYRLIRSWISGGGQLDTATPKVLGIEVFPQNPVIQRIGAQQQIRVVATYADGKRRDVTREAFVESGNSEVAEASRTALMKAVRRGEAPVLARYEGAYAATTLTVMGDRGGFVWQDPPTFGRVDELVAAKWQRMKIQPSGLCSDAEFLRRSYLDLTGLPPTADEVRKFLADKRDSRVKRDEVIDRLIGSEDYVDYWTNKWADLLQVNGKFLGREGATAFRDWIRKEVADNTPYDEFARKILTADGSNKDNPAASYYKILRQPDLMMENTTHLFLAVRFNCNKCHDHPFERWTQDQYYQTAAYFARVGLKADGANSKGRKIGGTAVEGAKPFYEIVYEKNEGEMLHERTKSETAPQFPFECSFESAENANRRQQLAHWITSPDNQYFAKSYVNRLWGYMLGVGIVEPIDDIRAGNPPTNPELLDFLTKEFIDSGFNVRHVISLICKSRSYQLSIETNRWNADDSLNYSHATARRLPAEVLFDAIHRVTGSQTKIPGVAPGTRAAALPDSGIKLADGFLNNLGRPPRESACECERSSGLQLGPVMALVAGPTVGKAIEDPTNALAKLTKEQADDRQMINELFLRILNRPATADEIDATVASMNTIDADHTRLIKTLEERESWWTGEKPKLEAGRLQAIAKAQAGLAAYEKQIQPRRSEEEKKRLENLAKVEADFKAYETKLPAQAIAYLEKQNRNVEWQLLEPRSLSANNKMKLERLDDRSIRATGEADRATYIVTVHTSLKNITGLRVEALPTAGVTGNGPGTSGNFAVTEFEVNAAPLSKPQQFAKVALQKGLADMLQEGFNINLAIDGNPGNQNAWAISPSLGVVHWATFETKQPLGHDEGTVLQFKIHHNHVAKKHLLARFRISATTAKAPIGLSLPESLQAIAHVKKEQRSAGQKETLMAWFRKSDKTLLAKQKTLNLARQPLPQDPGVTKRKETIAIVSQPVADDGKLVQLREDIKYSQKQQENKRLTAAQDLAWALINNPAFLFNH